MKFERAGIVAKPGSEQAAKTAAELAQWLARRDVRSDLDLTSLEIADDGRKIRPGRFDPTAGYDLVVVLGGDGTLLSVARSLGDSTPILGVNLGSLGFLTEINRGELYPSLVEVLAGRFETEQRSLLEVEIERAGGGAGSAYRVLNDAVITKGALASIIELTIRVDGNLVSCYRSDGLIVSTPTGSTAYNLSSGGPIVHPLLSVAVLTPICPHALTLRPVVVPDRSTIEVTLGTEKEEVYLTLDGQEGTEMRCGDTVRITRGGPTVHLVKVSGRSFYDSLRGKLHWGGLSETATPPSPSRS